MAAKPPSTRASVAGVPPPPFARRRQDFSRIHAGWRVIGGQRGYYRSRWEANYARYLEFLRRAGVILSWRHEPKTFWFEKIRRGVRSYLPDFEVGYPDGRTVYHEVKGYFDAKSKTKLKRMRKYHPDVEVRVIAAREYRDIRRRIAPMLKGWE